MLSSSVTGVWLQHPAHPNLLKSILNMNFSYRTESLSFLPLWCQVTLNTSSVWVGVRMALPYLVSFNKLKPNLNGNLSDHKKKKNFQWGLPLVKHFRLNFYHESSVLPTDVPAGSLVFTWRGCCGWCFSYKPTKLAHSFFILFSSLFLYL